MSVSPKGRAIALVTALTFTFTLTALAKDAGIDIAKSKITAIFTQSGVPVEPSFTKFSGRIVYDPANAAASSAAIDVNMTSLDIGEEAYNEEVRKPSWFDSAKYPVGSFRSTGIKPNGANKFDATGTLTLKGRALTISVPVTVSTVGGESERQQKTSSTKTNVPVTAPPVGGATAFDGAFTLSRKAFGIGDPTWEGFVDDKVTVKFHLVQATK